MSDNPTPANDAGQPDSDRLDIIEQAHGDGMTVTGRAIDFLIALAREALAGREQRRAAGSIQEAFAAARAVCGDAWDRVSDPEKMFRRMCGQDDAELAALRERVTTATLAMQKAVKVLSLLPQVGDIAAATEAGAAFLKEGTGQ